MFPKGSVQCNDQPPEEGETAVQGDGRQKKGGTGEDLFQEVNAAFQHEGVQDIRRGLKKKGGENRWV